MSDHGSAHHDNHHGPGDIEKVLANLFAGTVVACGRLAKSFMISLFNFLLRFLHWL